MHIFWHNDGVSIRPENQQEHEAIALLLVSAKLGRPQHLQPRLSEEGLHFHVGDHQAVLSPLSVGGEFGNQQPVVVVNDAGEGRPDGIGAPAIGEHPL